MLIETQHKSANAQLAEEEERIKALKESIKTNNKKVVGASNIRNLIRSAATRD